MRLNGKLAIVTAAASGMGRAGVERFVREGARVAAVDINADALDAACRRVRRGQASRRIGPISRPRRRHGASSTPRRGKLGGVDILWAHAGMPGPASVENLDLAAYRQGDRRSTSPRRRWARGRWRAHAQARRRLDHLHRIGLRSCRVDDQPDLLGREMGRGRADQDRSRWRSRRDNIRVNVVCPGLADTPMKLGFTGRSGDPAEARRTKRRSSPPCRWAGWSNRARSPTRCCGWPPTKPASSPASRSPSTADSRRADDAGRGRSASRFCGRRGSAICATRPPDRRART